MRGFVVGLVAGATLMSQAIAANPVARVSSREAVQVGGVAMPGGQIASVPVGLNEEIATSGSPAVIQFADGSTVTVQRNSRARIERNGKRTTVRVLQGTAMYDVRAESSLDVVTSALDSGSKLQTAQLTPANAAAANAVYRMPAAGRGLVIAPEAFVTGTFVAGSGRQAVGTPGNAPSIVLPNGIRLELTQQPTGEFTVSRVLVPVTTPGADGGTVFVESTSGGIIGATASIPSVTTGQEQKIAFTQPPAQSGQPGTSISPTQAQQLIQQAAQQALTDAQQRGQLPAGTTTVTPSPVVTGTFSRPGA